MGAQNIIGLSTLGTTRRIGRLGFGLLGLAVAALFTPATAKATLILSLTEGANSFSDSGPSNVTLEPADSSVGDFTYTDIQAKSNSPGSVNGGSVKLTSGEITNNASSPETLTIMVADSGFSLPGTAGSALTLTSGFAGQLDPANNGDKISMTSYADTNNSANASTAAGAVTASPPSYTSPGGSLDEFSSKTANGSQFTRSTPAPGLYSLAGVTTVTLGPGSVLDLSDVSIALGSSNVPEPASLALFAAGASLLMRRRRGNN